MQIILNLKYYHYAFPATPENFTLLSTLIEAKEVQKTSGDIYKVLEEQPQISFELVQDDRVQGEVNDILQTLKKNEEHSTSRWLNEWNAHQATKEKLKVLEEKLNSLQKVI